LKHNTYTVFYTVFFEVFFFLSLLSLTHCFLSLSSPTHQPTTAPPSLRPSTTGNHYHQYSSQFMQPPPSLSFSDQLWSLTLPPSSIFFSVAVSIHLSLLNLPRSSLSLSLPRSSLSPSLNTPSPRTERKSDKINGIKERQVNRKT